MGQKLFRIIILLLMIFFMTIISIFLYVMIPSKNNICSMSRNTCDIQQKNPHKVIDIPNNNKFIGKDYSKERDIRVLYDPLYPPENRTDSINYNMMRKEVSNRNFYVPTNNYKDNYRQIGYLSNNVSDENKNDSGGNVWKLMARKTSNNRDQFYMIPSNNNYSMKILLSDDIVKGRKIKDIYDIPNEIYFDTPLLSSSPYTFTELPQNDFTDYGYY